MFALRWWYTPRVAESTRPGGHCQSACSSRRVTAPGTPQRPCSVQQCGVASTDVIDRLEAAFFRNRESMLATDAGRWALFVQPTDRRRRPEFVGCFDDEHEACAVGFDSPIGRRFLVKAVLAEDPVVSVPRVVPADRR